MFLFATLFATGCIPVLYSDAVDTGTGPWVAPKNSWPMSPPPEGLEGEGFDPGQVVPEFRLPDQFGAEVSLWQFYGSLLVVDVSTLWCEPCQNLARDAQTTADAYRDQGLVYLTVLQQDLEHDIPDQDELNMWGDGFDIAEPIVSDVDLWSKPAIPLDDFPAVFLVDREMRMIERVLPVDSALLDAAIEEHL